LPLGACGYNKIAQAPEVAYDYRDRHPVVLAEAEHTIDVFPRPRGGGWTQKHIRESVISLRAIERWDEEKSLFSRQSAPTTAPAHRA